MHSFKKPNTKPTDLQSPKKVTKGEDTGKFGSKNTLDLIAKVLQIVGVEMEAKNQGTYLTGLHLMMKPRT